MIYPVNMSDINAAAAAKSTCVVIDGKETAETIRAEIKAAIETFKAKHGFAPGLSVVLVGERRDSQT